MRGDQGDYNLFSYITSSGNTIHIHGTNGRPRVIFSTDVGLTLNGTGSTANNLYVESQGTGGGGTAFAVFGGGSADNIVAKSAGGDAACSQRNATLTNSVCWGTGSFGFGLLTQTNGAATTDTVRNVTAIASDPSGVAVKLQASGGNNATMNLTNVIARGGADDLFAFAAGSETVAINTATSNWSTAAASGTNASVNGPSAISPPKFIDEASGDFHQACGSLTINAGTDALANGANDFDGDARAVGITDIGADEFVPLAPTVATGTASAVGLTTATLHGTINPNACATTYHFEYGTSTAYGQRTPDQTLPVGTSTQPVSATIGGLPPGTAHDFRLVTSSAIGPASGTNAAFATLPDPFAGVSLVSKHATVKKRKAPITLSCPADTPGATPGATGSCDGTLVMVTAKKVLVPAKKGKKKFLALGSAIFSIQAGKSATVSVTLPKKGVKLLKARGKLTATATTTAKDGLGTTKIVVGSVKLKPGK
ncbi:MAG: hypothetical protein QOK25_1121 [Thermoleophilaceae bacterium]|nr:hypothetical protein [Thermoleophilaceae bacterium]